MSGKVQLFPSIVQLTETLTNNNYERSRYGLARCLFGAPNPVDVKVMLEDELQQKSREFWDRWEILQPVPDTENPRKRSLENDENEERSVKKVVLSRKLEEEEKGSRIFRRALKPRNISQRLLSDFWTTRKSYREEKTK